MVGVDLNFVGFGANEVGEAVAHVASGGFSKSETENIVRHDVGLFQNICNTNGQELSFASTRAGDN